MKKIQVCQTTIYDLGKVKFTLYNDKIFLALFGKFFIFNTPAKSIKRIKRTLYNLFLDKRIDIDCDGESTRIQDKLTSGKLYYTYQWSYDNGYNSDYGYIKEVLGKRVYPKLIIE
jgi:hypothetical protein